MKHCQALNGWKARRRKMNFPEQSLAVYIVYTSFGSGLRLYFFCFFQKVFVFSDRIQP